MKCDQRELNSLESPKNNHMEMLPYVKICMENKIGGGPWTIQKNY